MPDSTDAIAEPFERRQVPRDPEVREVASQLSRDCLVLFVQLVVSVIAAPFPDGIAMEQLKREVESLSLQPVSLKEGGE